MTPSEVSPDVSVMSLGLLVALLGGGRPAVILTFDRLAPDAAAVEDQPPPRIAAEVASGSLA